MLGLALRMDLMRLKLNGNLQGMEDVLYTSRNLRPDSIARKEHNPLLIVGQPGDKLKRSHKLM